MGAPRANVSAVAKVPLGSDLNPVVIMDEFPKFFIITSIIKNHPRATTNEKIYTFF